MFLAAFLHPVVMLWLACCCGKWLHHEKDWWQILVVQGFGEPLSCCLWGFCNCWTHCKSGNHQTSLPLLNLLPLRIFSSDHRFQMAISELELEDISEAVSVPNVNDFQWVIFVFSLNCLFQQNHDTLRSDPYTQEPPIHPSYRGLFQ